MGKVIPHYSSFFIALFKREQGVRLKWLYGFQILFETYVD